MAETTSYAGVLSVCSIGGNSQLEFLQNANYRFTEAQQEGAPASRFGGNTQGVKMSGEISFSLFSDQATDIRVSHLDLSAATLASLDLLSPQILSSLELNVDYTHQMNPGVGDLWAYPVVADGRFSGSLRLAHMTDTAAGPLIDFMSNTYADKNKVLAFTINSVGFSVPFRMTDAGIPVTKDGLIEYTLALADRSARSGVTVLPSGTTSLLEKAFNQPRTALAFAFRPKAHPSQNFAGNMVIKSVRLGINDGNLVPIQYVYATQGTVTGAATSS